MSGFLSADRRQDGDRNEETQPPAAIGSYERPRSTAHNPPAAPTPRPSRPARESITSEAGRISKPNSPRKTGRETPFRDGRPEQSQPNQRKIFKPIQAPSRKNNPLGASTKKRRPNRRFVVRYGPPGSMPAAPIQTRLSATVVRHSSSGSDTSSHVLCPGRHRARRTHTPFVARYLAEGSPHAIEKSQEPDREKKPYRRASVGLMARCCRPDRNQNVRLWVSRRRPCRVLLVRPGPVLIGVSWIDNPPPPAVRRALSAMPSTTAVATRSPAAQRTRLCLRNGLIRYSGPTADGGSEVL